MSSYRGQVSANDIREGNIIQFANGTYAQNRGRASSYGYIHHVLYEPGNNDVVAGFDVFEIVPQSAGGRSGKRLFNITETQQGNPYGLPPGNDWVIVIDPQRVLPDQRSLGTSADHLVQRIGHIGATEHQDRLLQVIDEMGGESSLYYGDSGTGYSKSSVWELGGIPVRRESGLREYDPDRKPRGGGKARHVRGLGVLGAAKEGQAIDLPTSFAHQAVGLDQTLVEAFTNPASKRLKPIPHLRDVFTLADKTPEKLLPYVAHLVPEDDITLEQAYEKEYFEGVMDVAGLLSHPREGRDVKPVTHLLQLRDILRDNPDHLLNFYGVGKKTIENIRAEVEIAVENYEADQAGQEHTQASLKDIIKSVKGAWGRFTQDYLDIKRNNSELPERYLDQDNQSLIILRDLKGGPK